MGVKENEAALMRAVDAWNSGDVSAYLDLYSDEIKLHAGAYDFANKDAVGRMYKGMFATTSDVRLDIHETFSHEDALAARYTVTAKHTGELAGIPATGRTFAITGITIMHFKNGAVVERWDSDDSAEVFEKLRSA